MGAKKVALADLYAVVAQDGISRGDVEIHIWQHPAGQVVLAAQGAGFAGAGGKGDFLVFGAVQRSEKELAVLSSFLPPQLGRAELEELILKVLIECDAQGIKDMGKVMKALAPDVAGRAEGKVVADLVREKLT